MVYNTGIPMAESHLKKALKRKAIHNIVLVVFGFIAIILVFLLFGNTFLTGLSLMVSKSQGNDSNTNTSQQSDTYIAPPSLNPIPNATNKDQIDVSGFGQKSQSISLYVNDQLVDKTSVDDNNHFHFSSVALQSGQNTIKVKAEVNSKNSGFSNAYTISYLKNPPNLSINKPQDGQGFNKGDSPTVGIEGQTDPSAKVTVNGFWAIVDDQGNFNYLYTLKDGDNDIKVVATDTAGNQTTKEIHIHTQ